MGSHTPSSACGTAVRILSCRCLRAWPKLTQRQECKMPSSMSSPIQPSAPGHRQNCSERGISCPICGSDTEELITIPFGEKLLLPTESRNQFCAVDNFAFMANASQEKYDQYYKNIINDYHRKEAFSNESGENAQVSRQKNAFCRLLLACFPSIHSSLITAAARRIS